MARFLIPELYVPKLVVRHTQRMAVWIKLLNLGKKSALAELATNQLGYTPSSYDSDFYYNMITQQPEDYFSLSRSGLILTPAGETFRKSLIDEAQKKYPLTIHKVIAKNAVKDNAKEDYYTCNKYDRLIFECTFGKNDINFMLISEEVYNYRNSDEQNVYRLQFRVNDSDDPTQYSYWGHGARMKPVASYLLDSDALTERFKAAIDDKVKCQMMTWALKNTAKNEAFRDFI